MKAAAGRLLTMCNECAYLHIYPAFLPHIYAAIKRRPPHTITIRNRYVSNFLLYIKDFLAAADSICNPIVVRECRNRNRYSSKCVAFPTKRRFATPWHRSAWFWCRCGRACGLRPLSALRWRASRSWRMYDAPNGRWGVDLCPRCATPF